MPRRKNPECLRCAAQSVEEAQAKPCWKGHPCHARRSYYANHSVNKAKKRSRQRTERLKELDIPLYGHTPMPEVVVTFYRDRADGPIHAVEFAVIEEGQAISTVKPIHLKGVPQSRLRRHIKYVLGLLNAQFGRQQLPEEQELPLPGGQPPDVDIPTLSVKKDRLPAKMCPLCLNKRGAHEQ